MDRTVLRHEEGGATQDLDVGIECCVENRSPARCTGWPPGVWRSTTSPYADRLCTGTNAASNSTESWRNSSCLSIKQPCIYLMKRWAHSSNACHGDRGSTYVSTTWRLYIQRRDSSSSVNPFNMIEIQMTALNLILAWMGGRVHG